MAGDQKGKLPDVTDEMPTLPQGAAKEGSANGEASAAEEAASTGEDSAKGEASAAEAASTGEDSAKDAARATEDAAGQISDQAVTLKKPQGKIQLAPDAADDVVPAHGAAQTQPGDPGPELPRAGAPVQKTMPSRTRVLEPQGAKAPPSPAPARSPVATVANDSPLSRPIRSTVSSDLLPTIRI